MDVPEDIREKAKDLSERLYLTGEYPDPGPQTIIAQALLSERLAQKERDAEIAEAAQAVCVRHQEATAKELGAGGTYFSIPAKELAALESAVKELRAAIRQS